MLMRQVSSSTEQARNEKVESVVQAEKPYF